MKYKALEDLINILVKKSGTDLSIQTVSNEVLRLEEKKKKLKKEKDTLHNKLEKNEYLLEMDQEKDQNEKGYLEKTIKSLNDEKEIVTKELENFSRVLESGEVYYNSLLNEIAELTTKARKLKVKIEMDMDESGEAGSEHLALVEKIKEKLKEKSRKKLLEEEIVRIDDEIENTKEVLANLESRIEKTTYKDDLGYSTDKLLLDNCEEEIRVVEEAISMWQNSAEVLGAKILDAFKSGKDINEVKSEIDTLVEMSNKELKLTQEEINGSNIFEIMDNYDKLTKDVKNKVATSSYSNDEEKEAIKVKETYHKEKISKYKNNLDGINARKAEVLNLISVSKNLSEDVKRARLCNENKLISLENRLFNIDTLDVKNEELKNIDRLIGEIKVEIENDKYLENEYVDDIYAYKEELKNLDINYVTLQGEIAKEEKILDILNTKLNANDICEDKLEKLNDSILWIEYIDRLKSLRNQQQYLYVDSKVIKEEVYGLWKRTGVDDREEIASDSKFIEQEESAPEEKEVIEEVVETLEEPLAPEVAETAAPEVANEIIDDVAESVSASEGDGEIEVLDDFEFESLDEEAQ